MRVGVEGKKNSLKKQKTNWQENPAQDRIRALN